MKKLLILMCITVLGVLLASCSCESQQAQDHVHEWGPANIIKQSTKTEYGIVEYSCLTCPEKTRSVLAKLSHDHAFSEDWESDRMSHWHKCKVENCYVLDARAEHVWDGGEIITEANQQGSGEKKFTCTVCGYEKKESYTASSKVTSNEWVKAFERNAFENVTVVYSVTQNGTTNTTTVKVAQGKVVYIGENGDVTVRDDAPAVPMGSYGLAKVFAFMQEESGNVTYDSATRAYLYEKDGEKGSVQFSDGKITAFSIVSGGKTEKYTLSAYSRTVIE